MNRIKQNMLLTFLFLMLIGCSNNQHLDSNTPENESNQSGDILESFNRIMWDLNYNYLDPYILRPAAVTYVDYIPQPIRKAISNVLSNLDEPSSMLNNALMGNGAKAVDHFNRFWINSTLGLLGLIDIASEATITNHGAKTFGDAVGHYGVGNGLYMMVPAYGPYTLRETADFVDELYLPLSYLNIWAGLGKWALEGLETRASLIPQESMLRDSPDSYALSREVYLQRQAFKAEIESSESYNAEEEAYLDDYLDDYLTDED